MANRLRRHSLVSTTEAGSGHPTSCFSCADLVSTIFFQFLRFDLTRPDHPANDRFVLSKGHAAPVLYAALAEGGAFPVEKLLTLRRIDSELEGHPTPRSPWVDVGTGSLGQGLAIGVGMALALRNSPAGNRVYVLMGDGETAEGAVWEAAALAGFYGLDNLIGVVDVNGYGQSQDTMYGHDVNGYCDRFRAFGWHAAAVDGHDVEEIAGALQDACNQTGKPSVIVARTLKGKGVSFMEDRDGWHGKPISRGADLDRALEELGPDVPADPSLRVALPASNGDSGGSDADGTSKMEPPGYTDQDQVATRVAYGTGLQKLGNANPRVVALDGDTKNSTYSLRFMERHPDRFFECFIAEQAMVGAAVGMGAVGKIPFASTFAAFMTRAYDLIRMAAISQSNLKLCGSHAGVSIGEDGPSQMGLEDLAMMRAVQGSTVLYPSDAVATERLVEVASQTPGIVYIRTTRPKTACLYDSAEAFVRGGSKTVRINPSDRATVVAAGITLHEALKAHRQLQEEGIGIRVIDLYSVKPVDSETLTRAARETGVIVTVEDHYADGGLGDAVVDALAGQQYRYRKLAVTDLPRSGPSAELMDNHGIGARAIVEAVRDLVS
jgi:transketolase